MIEHQLPDQGLIDACSEFVAVETALRAATEGADEERLCAASEAIARRIASSRAYTIAGQAARARAVLFGFPVGAHLDHEQAMIAAVLRDLAALRFPALASAQSPMTG